MGHVDIFFGHGCSVVSVLPVAGVMRGDGRSKSHPPFTWRWSVLSCSEFVVYQRLTALDIGSWR